MNEKEIFEEIFEEIEVEFDLAQKIDVKVNIHDVIDTINENPQRYKWNYIAKMLNSIESSIDKLTDSEREMVIKFLTEKLKKFEP